MSGSPALTKSALRDRIKALLTQVDRNVESFAICCRLEELIPVSGTILAFEPLADEPDIRPITRPLARAGRLALVEGRGGSAVVAPVGGQIALALVPGRAFTSAGARLGRGGGTFDRILAALSCPRIGVAFDCQMVDNIPLAEHDVAMDRVVTPTRIHECGRVG